MVLIKMEMSETGLKLLERGISPTLSVWDEEYNTENDILVLVNKDDLVRVDEDLYEVSNLKSIEVIGKRNK